MKKFIYDFLTDLKTIWKREPHLMIMGVLFVSFVGIFISMIIGAGIAAYDGLSEAMEPAVPLEQQVHDYALGSAVQLKVQPLANCIVTEHTDHHENLIECNYQYHIDNKDKDKDLKKIKRISVMDHELISIERFWKDRER